MKLIFIVFFMLSARVTFAAVEKPANLGFSSLSFLEKEIQIEVGYGQGHYYDQLRGPRVLSEELVNQGFAMLNLFQYTDAFRSFETALSLDNTLEIAKVGRAFSAMSLDPKNFYYVGLAVYSLKTNVDNLDSTTRAWGNFLSSMVQRKSLSGSDLSLKQAYVDLKTDCRK